MLLANFDRKEHLQHRAVSLRQHGFLVGQLIADAVTEFGRRSPLTRRQNTGAVWNLRDFKSLHVRGLGLSWKRCKIVTTPGHSKIVCPVALAVIFILSRDKGLCQPQLTSTPTKLQSSSSRRLKECVLPPPPLHLSQHHVTSYPLPLHLKYIDTCGQFKAVLKPGYLIAPTCMRRL